MIFLLLLPHKIGIAISHLKEKTKYSDAQTDLIRIKLPQIRLRVSSDAPSDSLDTKK